VIVRHPDRKLALHLREHRADVWVEQLLAFQGKRCVIADHPFAQAEALRSPARTSLRVEIEARLLAAQSSAEIAEVTRTDATVIETFHAIHYDCRDRLVHGGYIVHQVLGSFPPVSSNDRPPLELAKWYGFFLGPLVLDIVLEVLRSEPRSDRHKSNLPTGDPARHAILLAVEASIAARVCPITNAEQEFFRLHISEVHRQKARRQRIANNRIILTPLTPMMR